MPSLEELRKLSKTGGGAGATPAPSTSAPVSSLGQLAQQSKLNRERRPAPAPVTAPQPTAPVVATQQPVLPPSPVQPTVPQKPAPLTANDKLFKLKEMMYGDRLSLKDGKITSPRLREYEESTPEKRADFQRAQDMNAPIVKFLNSPTGRKVTGAVQKYTSNVPLKLIAGFESLGEKTYADAYNALVAKSKDPKNNFWEKIMYGVQDSGVQSAIGALISVGTALATKSPAAGRAVGLAYFSPIAAESQRSSNEQGNVTSPGNIAIDTIGDTIISGFAESALKSVAKEGAKAILPKVLSTAAKGAAVEGFTEPTQTFLKYANDYKNAKTDTERQAVVEKTKQYVISGDMLQEFLVAGIAGGVIGGAAAGVGTQLPPPGPSLIPPQREPEKAVAPQPVVQPAPVPAPAPAPQPIVQQAPVAPPKPVPAPIVQRAPIQTPVSETVPEPVQQTAEIPLTREQRAAKFGSALRKENLRIQGEADTQALEQIAGALGVKPETSLRIKPEVIDKEKPLVIKGKQEIRPEVQITKTQLRQLVKDEPNQKIDMKVVKDGQKAYLTYQTPTSRTKIVASALGLIRENLKDGQTITLSAEDLKEKGTGFRVVDRNGNVEASLMSDLSDRTVQPAQSVDELKHKIEQLNKFGQSYALRRRTGGLSAKTAGVFRYPREGVENTRDISKRGQIHLQDEVVKSPRAYMETLAHELGHALEYTLTGATNKDTFRVFGKDPTAEEKKIIREELKANTDKMVGKETAEKGAGYYYKNTELLARFFEQMFASPGALKEIAPTAVKMLEMSAIETPIIAEYLEAVYGTIDKGERKYIFMRDMKQIYQKYLGTRVGAMAWNDEMRYRAMKERAKILVEKLVKDKFKGVKDSPEALFRAAESIKVTVGGEPVYGTRDLKVAKNDSEAQKMYELGWEPVPEADNQDGLLMAKARYTPEEAKRIFNSLSPEGQKLIKDFTAAKDEAKDYFNREVIKDVHKINSNLEGWVHHYWEDTGTGIGNDKLRIKTAAATKQRKGAEGYVEDLQKAMLKALTELETTKAYNAFVDDYFSRVSEPLAKGEMPKPGYVEVQGTPKRGGVGTPFETRRTVIENGKSHPIEGPRYQMPAQIYKRFQMIREVAVEASTAARVVNSVNRYWRVNILFHPGSAMTNFISGGVQYSTKILTDFYTDILTGNVEFTKTRRDLYAMLSTILPRGWNEGSPDWMYGGDTSNFYGQFGTDKTPGIKSLDTSVDKYADKVLKFYGTVERYWKKVIATAEGASTISDLNKMTMEGLRLPTEQEKEILDAINEEIDLYGYDYENVPVWLEAYQQSGFAQTFKPFLKYPYKYAKHFTELATQITDRTIPWQERTAKLLSLMTIVALYAAVREQRKEEQKTKEVDINAPSQVSTRGRFFIGTDENGKEMFTRTSKYPFINLTEAGLQFTEGNVDTGFRIIADMLGSVAPIGKIALAAVGYRSEYETYTPFPVIAGQSAASFVPGTRILSDIARFFDPYQRRPQTFMQGLASVIPTTDPALQEKLRGEIRTIQVPIEGDIRAKPGEGGRRTTVDMELKNYKEDVLLGLLAGLYINRIDPDVADAFITRKEENEEKKKEKERRQKILDSIKAN